MHAAQISFFSDPARRRPAELLAAWPTVVDIAEAAASAGVKVSVFQASAHWENLDKQGIRYHFLPFGHRDSTRKGRAGFRRLLGETKPDVLHVQGLGFARQVIELAKMAPGTPILVQDRANRPPRFWRRPSWRRGLAAARGISFCSRDQAEPFERAGLLPADIRIFEIPGSASRFMPGDQAEARRLTGLTGDPCLLWVGHLNANKDPLTVLEGVSRAAAHLPGLQLWCCFGEAPLMNAVQRRVEGDSSLSSRVHLLGRVPHGKIEMLMRAADFLVQGSHRESTGYSVIEALACGLPPIVTDIPSFRSLTAQGAVGRLWSCEDAAQLTTAILDLAARSFPPLRSAASGLFDRELSMSALGRKLRAAYGDLASNARAGVP